MNENLLYALLSGAVGGNPVSMSAPRQRTPDDLPPVPPFTPPDNAPPVEAIAKLIGATTMNAPQSQSAPAYDAANLDQASQPGPVRGYSPSADPNYHDAFRLPPEQQSQSGAEANTPATERGYSPSADPRFRAPFVAPPAPPFPQVDTTSWLTQKGGEYSPSMGTRGQAAYRLPQSNPADFQGIAPSVAGMTQADVDKMVNDSQAHDLAVRSRWGGANSGNDLVRALDRLQRMANSRYIPADISNPAAVAAGKQAATQAFGEMARAYVQGTSEQQQEGLRQAQAEHLRAEAEFNRQRAAMEADPVNQAMTGKIPLTPETQALAEREFRNRLRQRANQPMAQPSGTMATGPGMPPAPPPLPPTPGAPGNPAISDDSLETAFKAGPARLEQLVQNGIVNSSLNPALLNNARRMLSDRISNLITMNPRAYLNPADALKTALGEDSVLFGAPGDYLRFLVENPSVNDLAAIRQAVEGIKAKRAEAVGASMFGGAGSSMGAFGGP